MECSNQSYLLSLSAFSKLPTSNFSHLMWFYIIVSEKVFKCILQKNCAINIQNKLSVNLQHDDDKFCWLWVKTKWDSVYKYFLYMDQNTSFVNCILQQHFYKLCLSPSSNILQTIVSPFKPSYDSAHLLPIDLLTCGIFQTGVFETFHNFPSLWFPLSLLVWIKINKVDRVTNLIYCLCTLYSEQMLERITKFHILFYSFPNL